MENGPMSGGSAEVQGRKFASLIAETSIMGLALKLAGGIVLAFLCLAASAAALDVAFNDARLLDAVTGRSRLEATCLPELERELADRGFSPADIEMSPRPDATHRLWRRRSLAAEFTFQDGPQASRIDGVMACVLDGTSVHVEVKTRGRPVRAT